MKSDYSTHNSWRERFQLKFRIGKSEKWARISCERFPNRCWGVTKDSVGEYLRKGQKSFSPAIMTKFSRPETSRHASPLSLEDTPQEKRLMYHRIFSNH